MKYLSKQYRPAEKEFLRLAEDFVKMVQTDKEAKLNIHRDVFAFVDTLEELMEKVEIFVGHRIEREDEKERKEAEDRTNSQSQCPRCNDMVPVAIVGEIKIPKSGYTHNMLKCKVCKKEFTEMFPKGDEEMIAWQQNFITQMKVVEPDGRTRAERLETHPADLLEMEQKLIDFKEARRAELKAFKQQDDAEDALHKIVEEVRDMLLVMRAEQLHWNEGERPKA